MTMKKALLILFIFSGLNLKKTSAQCVATASNGDYTVTLNLFPTRIVPSSGTCPFGFTYNVEVGYDISITGSNPPSPITSGLYTSQGVLTCNNGTDGNQNVFIDLENGNSSTSVISTSSPYSNLTDCATATPQTYNCSSFVYEIQGPNLSANIPCTITSFKLPVNLVSFSGENMDGYNLLSWIISEQLNFDYFQVQRSFDAKSFETVSEPIKPAGSDNFSWKEKANISRENSYYRLLMKDLDGSQKYSKVIAINNFEKMITCEVFPNPTEDALHIKWNDNKFSAKDIKIFNLNGILVLNAKASNRLNLKELSSGVYLVVLTDESGRSTSKKFLKN